MPGPFSSWILDCQQDVDWPLRPQQGSCSAVHVIHSAGVAPARPQCSAFSIEPLYPQKRTSIASNCIIIFSVT